MKIQSKYLYLAAVLFLAAGFFGIHARVLAMPQLYGGSGGAGCNPSPQQICFSGSEGQNVSSQTLAISNSTPNGGDTGTWSESISGGTPGWLSVSPTSGSLAAGQSNTVTLSINPNQAPGSYYATMNFTGADPRGNSITVGNNSINIEYDVSAPPACGPSCDPQNPIAQNSSMNASVACDSIDLSWTPGANDVSYNLFRSTSGSYNPNQVWQTTTSTNFSDTTVSPNTYYYYWIQAVVSPYNTLSDIVAFNPASGLSATKCQADFSISDKVVTALNGKPYTYSSSCIGAQSGRADTIMNNDTVTFSIDICNRGNSTATGIQVQDTMTNAVNPANFQVNGRTLGSPGACGSGGHVTICGNIIYISNLPAVPAGDNEIITYDATVSAPQGNTQHLLRFDNHAVFIFTTNSKYGGSNQGCTGTGDSSFAKGCAVDTGPIVFYNGSKPPTQKEIQP